MMATNRKQRRAKNKKKVEEKEYDPLDNSNDQPFKEHMLHMKEAHDVGYPSYFPSLLKLTLIMLPSDV